MNWQKLFGERATTKIAGVFESESAAHAAADSLKSTVGLQSTQVLLVDPQEKDYAKKLEPEPQGIARTAMRAHIMLGLAGFVAGILVWSGLYAADLPAILSSPGLSAMAVIFLCTIAGLLLGGLVTSRPDHQVVIHRVRKAAEEGHWSLIVHPRTARECDAVMVELTALRADVVRTI